MRCTARRYGLAEAVATPVLLIFFGTGVLHPLAHAESSAKGPRVGVFQCEVGADAKREIPDIGVLLYDVLLDKLASSGYYEVVDWESFERVLKIIEKQQPNVSETEARRLAGQQLGIERIYLGSIQKLGKTYHITVKVLTHDLRVIDTEKATAKGIDKLETAIVETAEALAYGSAEIKNFRVYENPEEVIVEVSIVLCHMLGRQSKVVSFPYASNSPDSLQDSKGNIVAAFELLPPCDSHRSEERIRLEIPKSKLREAMSRSEIVQGCIDIRGGVFAGPGAGECLDRTVKENCYIDLLETDEKNAIESRDAGETCTFSGMVFVWCPPGEFMMGDSRDSASRPVHKVRFTRGFWIGKYEVTKAQWKAVMGTKPWVGRDKYGDRYEYVDDDESPAVCVSFRDAEAFCRSFGEGFRLPTGAEWEYACRAGSTTYFCFGDSTSALGEYAWYDDNAKHKHGAQVVGQKKPNAWGLFDMHGNAKEYTAYYKKYPNRSITNPDPAECTRPAIHGGSWRSGDLYCGSGMISFFSSTYLNDGTGFRVLRDP